MNLIHDDISKFFEEKLSDLNCQRDTKAYIVSIFHKYRSSDCDYSKYSVTSLFAQARSNHNFLIYQNLADWIFFVNSLTPEHFKHADKEYYDTIGRLSYYSCYRLINRQWKLFEELADNFIILENEVKKKFKSSI
jgi:hypothetical protein